MFKQSEKKINVQPWCVCVSENVFQRATVLEKQVHVISELSGTI